MANSGRRKAITWRQVEEQYKLHPLFGLAAESDFERDWAVYSALFNALALEKAEFNRLMTNQPMQFMARVEQLKQCWYRAILRALGIDGLETAEQRKTARAIREGLDTLDAFRNGRGAKATALAIAGGVEADPEFKAALRGDQPKKKYMEMFKETR